MECTWFAAHHGTGLEKLQDKEMDTESQRNMKETCLLKENCGCCSFSKAG